LLNRCIATAGLSLGEYTALAFAGVMDFETGLRLVQQRGQAMQDAADASPSGMVSILGLEREQVESLCEQARVEGETLQVANLLCPGNIAVSGSNESCERVVDLANQAGAMRVVPLAVAGAFHTDLMSSAVDTMAAALADARLSPPRISVVMNVDAQPHDDPEEIRELLIQQIVSPVRWEDSMRWLIAEGLEQFYEVGPGRVLRGLMRRIHRKVSCESVLD
jgi:[acyl-carrier-protein] S-malonyltransferase